MIHRVAELGSLNGHGERWHQQRLVVPGEPRSAPLITVMFVKVGARENETLLDTYTYVLADCAACDHDGKKMPRQPARANCWLAAPPPAQMYGPSGAN